MSFTEILKHENVIALIALYTFNRMFATFVYSVIPLWMETPIAEGGLGMEVNESADTYIGIAIPEFFF